ncbi:MAG: EAL domain-containing protein [Terracidiphilus sp.]
MPKPTRVAIAFAIGTAAVVIPIWASVQLAWNESVSTERALGLSYAHDVQRRTQETASQFGTAIRKLNADGFAPCSPGDLEVMRNLDLGSSYVQAVGRVSGNTLTCASLDFGHQIPLGPPSLTTDRGVEERLGLQLIPGDTHPLNVLSKNGVAIIIDPTLVTDTPTEGPDVELAVFVPSNPNRQFISAVGQNFPPKWLQPRPKGSEGTFLDNGYLVIAARSAQLDLAVVIAIPEHYIFSRVKRVAVYFTPIGLLCGLLLAWAVNYISGIRSSFPSMVKRAAKNKNFYVEYQPIVELESRRVIGAEALVRWKSKVAIVRPDHFIPLAEERGLIHLITEQVINIVTRDLPRFLEFNPDFEVAINMSAADLRSGHTHQLLDQMLVSSGVRAHNVEIEATERAFLQGPETARLIGTLRENGFSVAIDDFGTGYSSLACLQSLSLDTLKIDKAFVETIGTDGATSQVVQHIIEMARSLKLHIVAEGVETEVQAIFLEKRGVQYAQGWLFGKPVPINTFCKNLENQPVAAQNTLP